MKSDTRVLGLAAEGVQGAGARLPGQAPADTPQTAAGRHPGLLCQHAPGPVDLGIHPFWGSRTGGNSSEPRRLPPLPDPLAPIALTSNRGRDEGCDCTCAVHPGHPRSDFADVFQVSSSAARTVPLSLSRAPS